MLRLIIYKNSSLFAIVLSVLIISIALNASFKVQTTLPGVCKFQKVAKFTLFLIPVIGACWSVSLLAVNEKKIFYQYILTGLNILVGVFIFVFSCMLCTITKNSFNQTFVKRKVPSRSNRKPSSDIIGMGKPSIGKDNKGIDTSMVTLAALKEPAFHSKTNF